MITLKKYLSVNKRYYRNNYILNKELDIYNNIQEFINKHLKHIFNCSIDLQGTQQEATKEIERIIIIELKGLS